MLVLWLFDSPQFRNISGKDSASLNPQTKFTQKAWVPTAAEHKTHSSSASGVGSAHILLFRAWWVWGILRGQGFIQGKVLLFLAPLSVALHQMF